MKVALRLIGIGMACCALAACGGGGGSGSSGGGGSSDRQQIVSLFNGMFTAMEHGDYSRTCGYLSQRQQNNVVSGASQAGVTASSCADALTQLFKKAGITRAQLAQTFGINGAKRKVDSIKVNGNKATATFTVTTGNETYVETDAFVREGGTWRADRILKRTKTA